MRLECLHSDSGIGPTIGASAHFASEPTALKNKYQQLMSERGRSVFRDTRDRRQRNRSLTSLLCTPPPYPGYGALLASWSTVSTNSSSISPVNSSASPTSIDSMPTAELMSTSLYVERPKFSVNTPPLCSPEDDLEFQIDDTILLPKYSKASSGYGGSISSSSSDEHEHVVSPDPQLQVVAESPDAGYCEGRRSHVTMRERLQKTPQERHLEQSRRRSVPASLRDAFTAEMMRVLQMDGNVGPMETDVDTGMSAPFVDARRVNRPESVLELARKFAEISAQQEALLRRRPVVIENKENATTVAKPGGSGPTTPAHVILPHREKRRVGGIASLSDKQTMASRPNYFRQMDQMNAAAANRDKPAPSVVIRNPNSIKEALLRWCQSKVQGYPYVSVTNFSSSWADGMAFCALIHHFAPNAFNFAALNPRNRKENFELAFRVAEENGICPLLEVEDMIMMGDRPDWKCVFTYVQCFYKQYRDRP